MQKELNYYQQANRIQRAPGIGMRQSSQKGQRPTNDPSYATSIDPQIDNKNRGFHSNSEQPGQPPNLLKVNPLAHRLPFSSEGNHYRPQPNFVPSFPLDNREYTQDHRQTNYQSQKEPVYMQRNISVDRSNLDYKLAPERNSNFMRNPLANYQSQNPKFSVSPNTNHTPTYYPSKSEWRPTENPSLVPQQVFNRTEHIHSEPGHSQPNSRFYNHPSSAISDHKPVNPLMSISNFNDLQSLSPGFCPCRKVNGGRCEYGESWKELTGLAEKNYQSLRSEYEHLLAHPISPEDTRQIENDVVRTYAELGFYQKLSPEASSLKNILHAISTKFKEAGYVQGMNFITGSLFYHLKNEVYTFWVFVQLFNDLGLNEVFKKGRPGLL